MFLPTSRFAGLAGLSLLTALALSGCGSDPGGEASGSDSGKAPAAGTAGEGSRVVDPARTFPFTDVTAASGVDFVHDAGAEGRHHYVETMAPGVALFDADGDGDLDLYAVDGGPLPGVPARPAPANRLWFNRGDGTFEAAPEETGAGDRGYGMGVTVGDYDGDGDLDLYVLNYGPNALYRNDGQGRFEKVEAGVEDPTWSVSGAFFDADGDQDLDLYVVNYLAYDVNREGPCKAGDLEIYCSPEQYPPTADRLYRNDGGRFTDVSLEAGVVQDGRGMGIAVSDLDRDGDSDLYITNDRSHNLLYRNEGGRLEEVAAEAGVGYGPTGLLEGGMGVSVGDFVGDGQAAIFLTNFQKEPNRLYVHAGDGFYDDHTFPSGLGFPSSEMVGWGIGAVDVEGDGDLDLAVANGHVFENAEAFIPGSAHGLPDHFYLNDGSGQFALSLFPGTPYSSRGLAAGDLDGDGDQDLVITACGGPLTIWRNDAGRPETFLLLDLRGKAPNTHAFGARVTAEVGGRTLVREATGGGSYASHSDSRIYLGLGSAPATGRVEVRWSDGTVEELAELAGGQVVVWRQGEGAAERQPLPVAAAAPGNASSGGTP